MAGKRFTAEELQRLHSGGASVRDQFGHLWYPLTPLQPDDGLRWYRPHPNPSEGKYYVTTGQLEELELTVAHATDVCRSAAPRSAV